MPRLSKLSRSIAGRVAVVTGAASGMGRATARLLADEGSKVAVTDVAADAAEQVAAEIREAGGEASAWVLDVGDRDAVERVVGEVVARYGSVHILVNNAGISVGAPILDPGFLEPWERAFRVNLDGELHLIRACLPHLLEDGAGRIVNIASTEGLGATAGISPYTASKHAVVGLTRSLCMELGPTGVTINCICPGPIRTGMTDGIPEPAKEKFARRRVPLRRYGDPEEVAHMTLSLVLPAASFINGAVIPVDGGLTVQNT